MPSSLLIGPSSSSEMGQPAAATMARRACLISASRIHATLRFCSYSLSMSICVLRSTLRHGLLPSLFPTGASITSAYGSKPTSPGMLPSRYGGANPPGIQPALRGPLHRRAQQY